MHFPTSPNFIKNLLAAKIRPMIVLLTLVNVAACTSNNATAPPEAASLSTPELLNPEYAPVVGFSTCPMDMNDARLIQAISRGDMIPNALGGLDGVRLPLSIQEMNQWSSHLTAVEGASVPLVIDPLDPRAVFVAVFDGTWNDRADDSLPVTVPGTLSRELGLSEASTPGLSVRYYEGVGTRGPYVRRLWDGSTGNGTLERAMRALNDFRVFAQAQRKIPHVYVIGFSRGAASARHFLNLVEPYLRASADQYFYNRGRSFALLLDTVATGQFDSLQLDIPQATASAIQFRATRERRFSFPVVPLRPSSAKPRIGQTLIEFEFAGAHADLGGGYGQGLESLSLAMARSLLVRQGFALTEETPATQALLNMGRHNSDWPGTPIADALRDWDGVKDRRFVEPTEIINQDLADDPAMALLESSMRTVAAAKAAYERVSKSPPSVTQGMSFRLMQSEDRLVVSTNCPSLVQYDQRSRWFLLAGKPLFQVPIRLLEEAKAGRGNIWIYDKQDPGQFIPNKAR